MIKTAIETMKEILQLYKGNESFIKFLLFGNNRFNEDEVGHEPGEKIYVSKSKTIQLRQNEFLYRIYILNCLIMIAQSIVYNIMRHQELYLSLSTRMTFITFEMFLLLIFYDETYRAGIIELFNPNTERLKKSEYLLFCTDITMFIIYGSSVLISESNLVSGINFMVFLTLLIFVFIFIITNISHDKTNKMAIYSFTSNLEYSKSKDNVNLERDIAIKLKNGMVYQVNLLISEFLFCDNDDIIILVSKVAPVTTASHNITGLNKILHTTRLKKETIDKVSIGHVDLKYDMEHGWHKVNAG